jgi:hypothetical protein
LIQSLEGPDRYGCLDASVVAAFIIRYTPAEQWYPGDQRDHN